MDKFKLGKILKDMYENAPEKDQVAKIHLFGIEYANLIKKNKVKVRDIAIEAGISETYITEINKGIRLSKYVCKREDLGELRENRVIKGINKIYFGAPGTGKSRYVNKLYYNDFTKRVTFHPDYTYNDFIGYIRPITNEDNLSYLFAPGIFTEILVEALKNSNDMYTLIIEELNRANVSSVFGDIFQLLDRKDDGESRYRINNLDISKYIEESFKNEDKVYDGSIYIPRNLNIIATMNTADQNVFVMDTAFKRRWEFEYIPIKFDSKHSFKSKLIKNLDITWETFVTKINEFMMAKENLDLMISEDKQIGPYFINLNELEDSKKFAYKVLLYLWSDVFKMEKERLFNEEITTFSKLLDKFESENSIDIFNSNVKDILMS